jgi:quinol monooxygenase YgiN
MTTISTEAPIVTLVNVFEVAPENQQRLVDILVEATEEVMGGLPGFVSANFHKSLDGTRVVNYAQWQSREHFEAMLRNPAAQPHMRKAQEIGKVEPRLYEVVSIHQSGEGLADSSRSGGELIR